MAGSGPMQAYGEGIRECDKFVVAHAYGVFPEASESSALATLRSKIKAAGYSYVSDADARSPGDAHHEAARCGMFPVAPVFDPLQAAASATALVATLAFDARRLNRLAGSINMIKAFPPPQLCLTR